MSMPSLSFHPLADLFPLIEGKDFDDLVTSIKEDGQHNPIVLLDDKILDGRNRYRACLKAGIAPQFKTFSGANPVRFVMDHNIHRRHLNESQRAMIAAKLANMKLGQNQHGKEGVEISTPSIGASAAADLLNVNRATAFFAKKVLNEGTAEEIKAVESGEAAVSTVAKQIRAKVPQDRRKAARDIPQSERGKNPQRIENQRLKAQVWAQVRNALTALSSLPLAADVVSIVRAHDKAGFVDARLTQSLEWLKGFADEWSDRDQSQGAPEGAAPGSNHLDAGTRDRAA